MASRNNFSNDPEAGIQRLTPSEATRIFSGMSPLRATRYYNKIMTNPDTPQQNIDIVRQYRDQNPQRFLTDDQMKAQARGNNGLWSRGRGFSGGYVPKGMMQDGDGFYYDMNGNRYGFNVTPDGQIADGGNGYRFQGNGRANGFNRYYGAANQRPRNGFFRAQRKPLSQPRSYDELYQTVSGLRSDVARTRYFQKVLNNPNTPEETRQNLVRLRNNAPHMFASDEDAIAAGPQVQRKGFWASHWKTQEEFDSMAPKEKKFFVKAFQGRNRYRNSSYALKVMTNPTTSPDDKSAMASVVQKNPGLFFKNRNQNNGYGRN